MQVARLQVAGSKCANHLLARLPLATCHLYTPPMIGTELTAVFYGLIAAIGWGTGDFSSGVAAKKTGARLTVFIVNLIGFIGVAIAIVVLGETRPSPTELLFGVAAGVFGSMGFAVFLSGLSKGNMGTIAPLTAVISSTIPVIYSFFRDGAVEPHTLVGFALALIAIWIISNGGEMGRITWQGLKIPLVAGAGFGMFFILIDNASQNAVLWPVLATRVGSVGIMAILITQARKWKRPSTTQWPILLFAALFDAAGNTFFSLAVNVGRLDISAVLASLYPAITVLLARFILHETITRWQWVGLVVALTAVVLIAW